MAKLEINTVAKPATLPTLKLYKIGQKFKRKDVVLTLCQIGKDTCALMSGPVVWNWESLPVIVDKTTYRAGCDVDAFHKMYEDHPIFGKYIPID